NQLQLSAGRTAGPRHPRAAVRRASARPRGNLPALHRRESHVNAIRRFVNVVRDSPTFGRDRANLISGFSIGTAGLLLNAAVLLLVLPLMLDPDDRAFQVITESVGFGQLLVLILLGGASAFATLLIPLRLANVLWAPRL